MVGLPAGAMAPIPFSPVRKTSPASTELGAYGRLAVAAVLLVPLVSASFPTTIGLVALAPPTATRSTIETRPAASVLVKLTVRVPVPLALEDVVIQYAHW